MQNSFNCHKFQRLSNYRRGKIQLNATHWTPISNVSMPCWSQLEGYKLHSLLGSVGKRAETNFNFPAPPFNHISGICKNLADTWPAATRVLSRDRNREDPGNEVDFYISNVFFQFFNVTLYIALERPNCPMTYKIFHEMSHNQTKNKI